MIFDLQLEILGVLVTLIYIWLELIQKRLMWIVGFASACIYVLIYFQHKIYADMGMSLYYAAISVYGFWSWSQKRKGGMLSISRIMLKQTVVYISVGMTCFIVLFYILKYHTDSSIAMVDSLVTAASIVAMWMLAHKILEHWLVWMLINFTAAMLYFHQGLELTGALFMLDGALSVYGYFRWKKAMLVASAQQNL